ncbi:MAG: M20/M25/M40 family metallo-hydrolase [Halobacteriovoraceae bacterium]|nr:M20/M25/M40 family metallo-hydrolase [Halobacteriovoraceae bacterium]MCB9095192.1 M20/M25/M40 family metallo-hydrolase [Halobacteriovoraceae bacterium]
MDYLITLMAFCLTINISLAQASKGRSHSPKSQPREQFILMEKQVYQSMQRSLSRYDKRRSFIPGDNSVIMKVPSTHVSKISASVHEKKLKCGGFYSFDSAQELEAFQKQLVLNSRSKVDPFPKTEVKKRNDIEKAVSQVEEKGIREMILKLSSFKTRYYQHQTGYDSSEYIMETWKNITQSRKDIEVSLYSHNWLQPSVVLKIPGKTEEAIVLGGHLDSISNGQKAPGADDNASGISTLTEVLKILVQQRVQPEKTIYFMGYAAEEVGLKGSRDIAKEFKNSGKKVAAVLQLDMTNYHGSADYIYFMTDYVSKNFTKYLQDLTDTYVKVNWGTSQCGYKCSDHASWNDYGYAAGIPFESSMHDYNPEIHTPDDKIEVSGGVAEHAVNFAKLALAMAMDLGA